MKILHCCLANFFVDNYNYQENMLPAQNKADGHDVKIIASTETYLDNSVLGYVQEGSYNTADGIPVLRLRYAKGLPHFIAKKIRAYNGVYGEIEKFGPDMIFFHGVQAWELLTVAKYKKNNPAVQLFVDCHSDFNNSARTFISRHILHRIFYRFVIKIAYSSIDKIYYVANETRNFLFKMYRLPKWKMAFLPLGGIVIDGEPYQEKRRRRRAELGIDDEDILLCHSGKMDKLKRTGDLLDAMFMAKTEKLKLIIIGSLDDETKDEILSKVERDSRVKFLGWKYADELMEYLCACDLYVQPGSQSATMQNAICCSAPVMLHPHMSHIVYLKGNGWTVRSTEDMTRIFCEIADNPTVLKQMSENSHQLAKKYLDYKNLAKRLYEEVRKD